MDAVKYTYMSVVLLKHFILHQISVFQWRELKMRCYIGRFHFWDTALLFCFGYKTNAPLSFTGNLNSLTA